MYYAVDLFVKKGPLAKLWMAGTCFKNLSKKVLLTTDVEKMCETVMHPPVSLALRASATLFKGICRIENKKAVYLHGTSFLVRRCWLKQNSTSPAFALLQRTQLKHELECEWSLAPASRWNQRNPKRGTQALLMCNGAHVS